MPHYSFFEYSDPRFVELESYHLTRYDDSYSSDSPYGEPISPYENDFFYEPSSLLYPDEVDFTGRIWNEYGLTNQACKEWPLQLPYNANNDWLGEHASYFDGQWKENISYEYGAFDYKFGHHENSLEKAEETYLGEERYDYHYSCADHGEERPAHDYNPWFGSGFTLVYKANGEDTLEYEEHDYNPWFGNGFTLVYDANEEGTQEYEEPPRREYEPLHGHNMYEMRLCERIFGYWPPPTADQEAYA